MTKKLYGIDPEGEVTAAAVRDALVECFFEAHRAQLEVDPPDEETERSLIRLRIRKMFSDIGSDYDAPTRESIVAVIQSLKQFSTSFRDPSVIEKHAAQMLELVDKIK